MNYNAGRPVVVNSLLCFLKNYRDQNNILQIIDQHFTLDSRRLSYQILLELLSENDKLAVVSSSVSPSLLELFDRVSQSNIVLPIFATDDLTVLPLSLNYEDGVEQPKDLYSEVKQLRFYVHNALGQKTYNSYPWKRQFDLNPPPVNSSNSCIKSTGIHSSSKQKQSGNVDRYDFNVSSLLKQDSQRSVLQCSPTSSSSSSSEITNGMAGQQRRLLNRQRKHTGGNRLDKAVQKLTERLRTETNNNEDCNYNLNGDDRKFVENGEVAREKNNNTIASFGSSAAAITAQILQNITSKVYETNAHDNKSHETNNAPIEEHSNDIVNDEQPDMDRELLNELDPENERTSSQSSPTPSDVSMTRDGVDSTNDSDKPYVCSKINCQKRFSNKFLLKKHEFIHSGLRPHVCPFCAKQFNRKDNLLRHKKTHLNNALAQMTGRRRHNALCGVTEEAANFHLFQQGLIEEQRASFQFVDSSTFDPDSLEKKRKKKQLSESFEDTSLL